MPLKFVKARSSINQGRPILQCGVSMVEVLITIIILSIGFLAAASMQIQSIRTNQRTNQQALAMVMLDDMLDRMRSNLAGVEAGNYDNVSTGTLSAPTCDSTGCSVAKIAALDLFDWSANFESLRGESKFVPILPPDKSGDPAKATISAPVDGVYTLTINWEIQIGSETVDESVSVNYVP